MAKITLISMQEKNKKRCNLFLDGEFYAGVSMEIVLKYRLKVGQDVSAEILKELISESERAEALNKAVDYISNRLKTKRELKDYLIRKGYAEEVVWYCIDKLKEYNYINDEEYSRRYIESTAKNQGKNLTQYKLMMKGVRKEDVESAFNDVEIDSKQNAYNVAVKYLKNKDVTKENLAKTYRYLIGKGFTYEDTNYAIDRIRGEKNGESFDD